MKLKKEVRLKVFYKYGGNCSYCGEQITYKRFQVDHIEPKFRGSTQEELDYYNRIKGKDHINNYNPSCASCNASKSTFTLEQWREELSLKVMRIRRDSSTFRILERFGAVEVKDISIKFHFETL
jgi:hypothetical protein